MKNERFAIVLAAGEGERMRSLTRDTDGTPVPKQFCTFGGDESLLGRTSSRARCAVAPERVLLSLLRSHRRFWERELLRDPTAQTVVQPRGRGTAPGLLLPLLVALLRAEDALVLVLPSDHHVDDELVFGDALEGALRLAAEQPWRIFLLGTGADSADTEYGWLVPEPGGPGAPRGIVRFVEKPLLHEATELLRDGALWNTSIIAASGAALLAAYEEALPDLLARFLECLGPRGLDEGALAQVYERIGSSDLSRDVLERACHRLSVLHLPACGWMDLGTPERAAWCVGRRDRPWSPSCGAVPDIGESIITELATWSAR